MKQQRKRTVRTALEAARAIIKDPKQWTQNAFYRNAAGQELAKPGPSVAKVCAMGAIHCVTDDGRVRAEAEEALSAASRGTQAGGVIFTNDGPPSHYGGPRPTRKQCHEGVVELYDAALREVRA
jgi:hypothetical protein